MSDYTKLSQKNLSRILVKACRDGKLPLVKYLLESEDLINKAQLDFNHCEPVKAATLTGRIDVVKYILENKDTDYSGTVYNSSFETGQLDILKYVLTLPQYIENKSNAANLSIIMAATFGQIEVLDYFLTDSQYKNIDKKEVLQDIFPNACSKGYVDMLKYLINSYEFVKNVNISDMIYSGIYQACEANQIETFKYFIFDLDIEFNQHIEDYLLENNRSDIIQLFNKRDLNKNLQLELVEKQMQDKKMKI
jgi:ankyrin repeat protein